MKPESQKSPGGCAEMAAVELMKQIMGIWPSFILKVHTPEEALALYRKCLAAVKGE